MDATSKIEKKPATPATAGAEPLPSIGRCDSAVSGPHHPHFGGPSVRRRGLRRSGPLNVNNLKGSAVHENEAVNTVGLESMSHSLDLLKDTYNYNHWIYSLIRAHLGQKVLEAGSGQGNITRFLLDRERVYCLEPEPFYLAKLQELAEVHRNVSCVLGAIQDLPALAETIDRVDSVICINVLEHIEDDAHALECMRHVLRERGKLILYVPACQWAFGTLDVNLGHFRRYERRRTAKLLQSVGYQATYCRAVNIVGAFGWCLESRVRRQKVIDPGKARFMDRLAPFLAALEKIVRPPFGQSLLYVAEKA